MLKLKLQYFDHLMGRTDSLEKTLMLGGLMPPLEMRPSSIAPNPVESREAPPNYTVSLTSQRHP